MAKYRKKPVVIDAWQWQGKLEDMPDWLEGHENVKYDEEDELLVIETMEGVLAAQKGHWIIKGVKGELYPCAPDVFEKTYEQVDETTG